ncbi:MAG: prepilin-type N-terminal cleavage/methylation domain-containing protein [Acidobacteriota bacterium]|nr:prepilin-type N-terminal cleavage/methylation domain-containing protein [Acidobacteriota bacterium]
MMKLTHPWIRRARGNQQRGMSMIELLIAMTVLAIGVSGILSLVLLAIAANQRSKGDTTSTMLAQLVIEQAQMVPANGVVAGGAGGTINVPTVTVRDCANTAQVIRLTAGGANVTAGGLIDWSQLPAAVPAGFQMNYAACMPNAGANQWMLYDVRWNITQPYGAMSKQIVVSARPAAAQFGGAANFKNFATPVTLRTVVSQ